MTKTEELLNNVAAILSQEYPEDSMMAYEFEMKARGLIEPIIVAAHAEGVAEGVEQERERIQGVQLYGYRVELHPYYPLEISIIPTRYLLASTKEVAG